MADLFAWIHAVWTPWLDVALVVTFGTAGLRWALKTADKEKARGAATRPGRTSHASAEGMDMDMIRDREGEALPPFTGPLCRDCAEGVCDKAEHLGLTDADVPLARCPNCLDLTCAGCMDPSLTGGGR